VLGVKKTAGSVGPALLAAAPKESLAILVN